MIVDFCAGAGGKTLALGATMRSTGPSLRVRRLRAGVSPSSSRGCASSGLSNVNPVLIDSEHDAKIKRLAGKIDRVLVDAPVQRLRQLLRRNPDLKWRAVAGIGGGTCAQAGVDSRERGAAREDGRASRVRDVLACSKRRNEAVVQQFLADHPNFSARPGARSAGRAAHRPRNGRLPVALAASPRRPTASSPPCSNARAEARRGCPPARRSILRCRRAGHSATAMQNRLFSHLSGGLTRDFGQPVMLWQIGLLLTSLAIAWLLARVLRQALDARRQSRYRGACASAPRA